MNSPKWNLGYKFIHRPQLRRSWISFIPSCLPVRVLTSTSRLKIGSILWPTRLVIIAASVNFPQKGFHSIASGSWWKGTKGFNGNGQNCVEIIKFAKLPHSVYVNCKRQSGYILYENNNKVKLARIINAKHSIRFQTRASRGCSQLTPHQNAKRNKLLPGVK